MSNCILGFVFLFIFILILLIVGTSCAYSKEIGEKFANLKLKSKPKSSVYGGYDKYLQFSKETGDLGMPTGFLSIRKTDDECDTVQNQLIQNGITFKEDSIRKNNKQIGCTYIDKKWPA